MKEFDYYLWLVKTNKGNFFIHASGNWNEAQAAQKVMQVFKLIKVDILGMIPRKRATGPDDAQATIVEQLEPKTKLGFDFMAGRKLWEVCGRLAEYEAELVVLEHQMKDNMGGRHVDAAAN